jgi:hypothetical protein
MLFRPTSLLGAAGIIGLYAYGIARYGAFHMMDYAIFPGLAAYLVFTAVPGQTSRELGLPVLYTSSALTMMWGAVEKFLYPSWTLPLLAAHRELTLGLNFERFMVIAGFVAFQSGLLHPDGHPSAAFGVPGVAGTADKCGAGIRQDRRGRARADHYRAHRHDYCRTALH